MSVYPYIKSLSKYLFVMAFQSFKPIGCLCVCLFPNSSKMTESTKLKSSRNITFSTKMVLDKLQNSGFSQTFTRKSKNTAYVYYTRMPSFPITSLVYEFSQDYSKRMNIKIQ